MSGEKIQAHFYPDVDKKELETGVMTYISFQRLQPFLEKAIDLKPNERLVGITVDGCGLKCKIEMVEPPSPLLSAGDKK
jgi:hypothetical protein